MEEQEREQWRRSILTQMRNNSGEISFRRLHASELAEFERMTTEGVVERLPDESSVEILPNTPGIYLGRFSYRLTEDRRGPTSVSKSH